MDAPSNATFIIISKRLCSISPSNATFIFISKRLGFIKSSTSYDKFKAVLIRKAQFSLKRIYNWVDRRECNTCSADNAVNCSAVQRFQCKAVHQGESIQNTLSFSARQVLVIRKKCMSFFHFSTANLPILNTENTSTIITRACASKTSVGWISLKIFIWFLRAEKFLATFIPIWWPN